MLAEYNGNFPQSHSYFGGMKSGVCHRSCMGPREMTSQALLGLPIAWGSGQTWSGRMGTEARVTLIVVKNTKFMSRSLEKGSESDRGEKQMTDRGDNRRDLSCFFLSLKLKSSKPQADNLPKTQGLVLFPVQNQTLDTFHKIEFLFPSQV